MLRISAAPTLTADSVSVSSEKPDIMVPLNKFIN